MWLVLAGVIVVLIVLYLLSPLLSPKKIDLVGAHVMITGGSSGIGKALAVEAVKRGASVSLLARNQKNLEEARSEVEKALVDKSSQKVICVSVDVSQDVEMVQRAVKKAMDDLGPVRMLVNSAGVSVAGAFKDLPVSEFKRMVDINYLGSVNATKAVLPTMLEEGQGRIVFVSSQAGQLGLFGYTAYSASKFALRGLAEALQMEVKPYNIRVTLSFPPDTDTPGFAKEQIGKPRETQLIAETAGLFQPDFVAKKILNDSLRGAFFSEIGIDGFMLATLSCGMSPVVSIMEALGQFFLMGPFRLISLFYLAHFDKIVKKCKDEKTSAEKKDS